ncbi:MAG: O-antigen ligase family protein, partial [Rhodospirillaceae bacterium]
VGVALLLVQVAFGHSFGELLSHRALPGTITPKAMSRPGTTFALMVWPAAIILYRRGLLRLAWLLPAGYAALTPLLHHRASVVAMAGALVVLVAATKAPVMTRRILAGILTLLFVGAVPIAEGLHQAGLEDAAWLPSSARHRVEIWQFTADRVLEQPLTGVGLDASGSIGNHGLLSRFQEPGTTIIPLHPHSVFLQIWVELGLPGVVLALGVALGLLAALVRVGTGSLQPFALAGFTSCWIISAMSFGAWQAWWLGAILLSAAALALSCRADHP